MNEPIVAVSVIMRLTPTGGRWANHVWQAQHVLPQDEAYPLQANDMRVDGHAIGLYRAEAEGYFLNVSAPEPRIFVHWRLVEDLPEIVSVTLSYGEAARWLDAGEQVDALPMPKPMLAWLDQFVALHYKPEPKKRKRVQSFMTPQERNQ